MRIYLVHRYYMPLFGPPIKKGTHEVEADNVVAALEKAQGQVLDADMYTWMVDEPITD